MDQDTIKAIADQIADQTILTSWKTWGLQFGLWIIGTAVAAFAGAFFAKRGEHKAIKADFKLLKMQLAENTTAVKTIETEIAHADWAVREWKTIRRIKLEELLDAIHGTQGWLALEQQSETLSVDTLLIDRIKTLTKLYFIELSQEVNNLLAVVAEARSKLAQSNVEIIAAKALLSTDPHKAAANHAAALQHRQKQFLPLYEKLLQSEASFAIKASALMQGEGGPALSSNPLQTLQ